MRKYTRVHLSVVDVARTVTIVTVSLARLKLVVARATTTTTTTTTRLFVASTASANGASAKHSAPTLYSYVSSPLFTLICARMTT